MSTVSNNTGQLVPGYFIFPLTSTKTEDSVVPLTSSKELLETVAKREISRACNYCSDHHLRCDNKDSSTRCEKAFLAKKKQKLPGSGVIRAVFKTRRKSTPSTTPIPPRTITEPPRIQDLLS